MDTPRILSASESRISVDWSLIAITLVAVALLAATTIRTSTPPVPGATVQTGGLSILGTHETLIAFEDFNFGAHGWTSTAARASTQSNAVYGPFDVGAVEKTYALPSDTAQVRVAFDLHLADDDGSDGFSVRINGQSVIEGAAALNTSNAVVTRRGPTGAYAVWIRLDQPGDAVSLQVEAIPGPDAAWAIDNVSVVASGRTS
jgi:hypothetical protein